MEGEYYFENEKGELIEDVTDEVVAKGIEFISGKGKKSERKNGAIDILKKNFQWHQI